MNIVAHTGSVRRVIIIAPNIQVFAFSDRNLRNIRHQVVWNAVRILAHCAALMRADRVKIAQQTDRPSVVRGVQIFENALDHIFCSAVRVGYAAHFHILCKGRDIVHAVNGCGRGKNDLFASVIAHNVQQHQCAVNIVVKIFKRFMHAFSNCLKPGEMDHGIDLFFFKDLVKPFFVSDIALIEFKILFYERSDPVQA